MKPWHIAKPALFEKLKEDVRKEYPDLRVVLEDDTVYLRGSFPISFEGQVLDRYQIQVELPSDYPDSVPIVRETGGRIPWMPARHIKSNTGEACIVVPEEWLLSPNRDSIVSFLDGPVRNFFIGQTAIECGQPWPFGERSHGINGLLESYGELLGVTDRTAIRGYFVCLTIKELKGHWICPCGSGKRLRQCHIKEMRTLREKVKPHVARQALNRLDQQKKGG